MPPMSSFVPHSHQPEGPALISNAPICQGPTLISRGRLYPSNDTHAMASEPSIAERPNLTLVPRICFLAV